MQVMTFRDLSLARAQGSLYEGPMKVKLSYHVQRLGNWFSALSFLASLLGLVASLYLLHKVTKKETDGDDGENVLHGGDQESLIIS